MKYSRGMFVGLRLDLKVAEALHSWVITTFSDFNPLYPVPPEYMHSTIVMTGKNIKEFEAAGKISVPIINPGLRTLKGRTDRALIMMFDTTWYDKREQEIREEIFCPGKGGLNIPHITLSYGFPAKVNLKDYKLPNLNYEFVEEFAAPYKRDWKTSIGVK